MCSVCFWKKAGRMQRCRLRSLCLGRWRARRGRRRGRPAGHLKGCSDSVHNRLRPLWFLSQNASNTIKGICRHGQQYCTDPMANNHWRGNDHGYGWESHKSLLSYKFIERTSHRSFATGFNAPTPVQALRHLLACAQSKPYHCNDGYSE